MKKTVSLNAIPGTVLLDAIRDAGVDIDAPCGGQGTCGRCAVRVVSGAVTGGRSAVLEKEQLAQGWVLACEARAGEGTVVVEVPEVSGRRGGRFAEEGGALAMIAPGIIPDASSLSPLVGPAPSGGRPFGIAVDVGTTTVGLMLVALDTGEVLSTQSEYNAQIACGLDVIGRINYAGRRDGLAELQRRVVGTINTLIRRAIESVEVAPKSITELSLAGNTTMVHLLLAVDPEPIRIAPYKPLVLAPDITDAGELGLAVNPTAPVLIAPAVGSYVGGDITSGLLCTPLAREGADMTLFMDIGTNGELVLGNDEFLLTCACSAGPAFEGGGISCGMRAAHGAIDKVDIDAKSGVATCRVIGDGTPVGICGSGLLSLVSGLVQAGILDPAGRLNRDCPMVEPDGRRARYVLVPPTNGQRGLNLREVDIDNFLRAKAAVFAACRLMLEQTGLSFDDLVRVYIAGGFGRNLDIDAAVGLGLLPDIPRARFTYLGNTSLAGALASLLSAERRAELAEVASRMTYLELNTEPAYMDQYTAAMFIPHTDATLFPSVTTRR
jgi:uncharacterized 2Fe-2S/4Fe-4S cluster protein (DUF4445 family)